MAKRYYQDKKDRMDESKGMKAYDARKRDEKDFSGMIKEDKSATANLPQNVIMTAYPKVGYAMDEYLDDTIRGIDNQINDDMHGKDIKKGKFPEKY